MTAKTNEQLFERARQIIPGGVNSPVRAFKGVGGVPRFIERADGASLWDVEGNQYVDYVGSWGVMVLGHNHPKIREAIIQAVERGTSFGAPTSSEVQLAELLVELVPSIEVVRLVNSGTEATMSAVRLARAVTGASKMIKFRGGYHGHADSFLVDAGSGAATLGVPSSPGVTKGTSNDTLVAEYNDLASVENLLEEHPGRVACVIVEPVAGNMGCVPPVEGFLAGLRTACDKHNVLLIFDEVMSGFRVARGGAQELYGVMPDLTTLGKVIGGGLPVGAYGGREDLMRHIAPDGDVYQAGTLSGNPLATAAGIAALSIIQAEPQIYDFLETLGSRFDSGWREIQDAGFPVNWNRAGAMGSPSFTAEPVIDWPTASSTDVELFRKIFWYGLENGVYLPPSAYEAWFWSTAHTLDDVDTTLDVMRRGLEEFART